MTPGIHSCIDRRVEIRTSDGIMPVFVTCPPGTKRWPAVVLYMDAVGIRNELREIARFIAARGYVCAMPNLYYRDGGPSFDPHEPFRDRGRFMPLADRLSRDRILSDTAALLKWADTAPEIEPGPKGCIGFCMGGRFVVWAAAEFDDAFRAVVSLFGPRLVTDAMTSPHRLVARVRGRMFFGFGGADQFIPAADIAALEEALAMAGCNYRIEIYPGAEHAFIFPQRWCYQREASERAWIGAFETLALSLKKQQLKRLNEGADGLSSFR